MELSCLVGVCSAMAQAASAPEAAASGAGSSAATQDGLIALATMVGIVSVLLAQLRSGRIVRLYGQALLDYMGAESHKALGLAALPAADAWDAPALLRGMERQHRLVRNVLVGVVLVYAAAAAAVMLAHSPLEPLGRLWWLQLLASFLMFAAFSGPVVLLGVSAANFGRLFWRWFAPLTFASVAVQVIVASVEPDERLRHVVGAMAAVAAVTAAAVVVRQRWPGLLRALRERGRAYPRLSFLQGVVVAVLVIGVAAELNAQWVGYLLGGSLVGVGAIVLCYLTLVDRIRRIVAPLLVAGYSAALLAAFGVFGLTLENGHQNPHWTWVLFSWTTALAAGWLARQFVISWVGLAYEQKVFSDAQFQVFCWMLSVASMVIGVGTAVRALSAQPGAARQASFVDPINLWLLAATVLALVVYWLIIRYGVQPLASNKRLLVLRVFSRGTRGEKLMDELEYRWRFIGPIVLIGGKDVAARTIDPAKAANFLRRRLRDNFVPNLRELNKRIVAMDEFPDPDGRYRVNEFFCFNDLWREAVRRLLAGSDAVVLDLSEFSADREGTAWELAQLREHAALAHTVFLFGPDTDREAVRHALQLAPGEAIPAQVIEIEGHVNGRKLMEALVGRMRPAPT